MHIQRYGIGNEVEAIIHFIKAPYRIKCQLDKKRQNG